MTIILASCALSQKPRPYESHQINEWTSEARFRMHGYGLVRESNSYRGLAIKSSPSAEAGDEIAISSDFQIKIDASKAYDFDVIETTYLEHDKKAVRYTGRSLAKVSDADQVIFDASICQLHHQSMIRKTSVEEGIDEFGTVAYKAQRRFPNDGVSFTGCSCGGIQHVTWVCPVCDQISKSWRDRHSRY